MTRDLEALKAAGFNRTTMFSLAVVVMPWSGTCATGLATLRRDGFVSMDSFGAERQITTRPVSFNGRFLFVNVDAPESDLRVCPH